MSVFDDTLRVNVSNEILNHLNLLNDTSIPYHLTAPFKNLLVEVATDFNGARAHILALQTARVNFEGKVVPGIRDVCANATPLFNDVTTLVDTILYSQGTVTVQVIKDVRTAQKKVDSRSFDFAATVNGLADSIAQFSSTVDDVGPLDLPFDDIAAKLPPNKVNELTPVRDFIVNVTNESKKAGPILQAYSEDFRDISTAVAEVKKGVVNLLDLLLFDSFENVEIACANINKLSQTVLYQLSGKKLFYEYKLKGHSKLNIYHPSISGLVYAETLNCFKDSHQPGEGLPATVDYLVPYSSVYTDPPRVALGLCHLDIGNTDHIRTDVHLLQGAPPATEGFQIQFAPWEISDNVVNVGATWLELPSDDLGLQHGGLVTKTPDNDHAAKVQEVVTFERPYSDVPRVVAWLTHIDTFNTAAAHRFAVSVSDVTLTGFKINFSTDGDSNYYTAGAEWLAFPGTRPDIAAFDNLNTTRVLQGRGPADGDNEALTFDFVHAGRSFANPPRVFYALRAINIAHGQNPELGLNLGEVTKDTGVVNVRPWGTCVANSIGVTVIAIAQRPLK